MQQTNPRNWNLLGVVDTESIFFNLASHTLLFVILVYIITSNPLLFAGIDNRLFVYVPLSFISLFLIFRNILPEPFSFSSKVFAFYAFILTFALLRFHFFVIPVLLYWAIAYAIILYQDKNYEDEFYTFILALSGIWAVTSVFITLGTTIFDFSTNLVNQVHGISTLLDLRVNLIIIILFLITIKAAITTFKSKSFEVEPLFNPREEIVKSSPSIPILEELISSFLNLSINLLASIGNLFYILGYKITLSFIYIGEEIAELTSSIIRNSIDLLLVIAKMVVIVFLAFIANEASELMVWYLREGDFLNAAVLLTQLTFTIVGIVIMVIGAIYLFMATYVNGAFNINIGLFKLEVKRVLNAFVYLLIVFWLTGWAMFAISRFFELTSFNRLGIFTSLVSLIVFVGFIHYVIKSSSINKKVPRVDFKEKAEEEFRKKLQEIAMNNKTK